MPRIAFTADFDWYPPERGGRWCRAYKAGFSGLVTTPCAAAAVAAGKAVRLTGQEKVTSKVSGQMSTRKA